MFVRRDAEAAFEPVAPNPAFGLAAEKAIRLPARWHKRAVAQDLASRVARKPGDLLSHMRRLWLHRDLGDAAGTAGAAVDLFIAVQDKGRELKQRTLQTFAGELRQCGCYEALQDALDGRLSRHDARVARPEALLARPVRGGFDFLRRDAAADVTRDLADELRRQGLADEASELESGL